MDATLSKHIKAWEEKAALRVVYIEDIYKRIEEYSLPGKTLEIGSGAGFLKKYNCKVISSDILFSNHLDVVCNSHLLSFSNASFMNIVGVDVLHHLERPYIFFDECERVLKPGGRLILVEPWISPISRLTYTYFHHEDCHCVTDPLEKPFDNGKDPWKGNSMIPYQIFSKANLCNFKARWPNLKILALEPFSTLAYPLTGGFKSYGLKSEAVAKWLLWVERVLKFVLLPVAAFRILVVMENIPEKLPL